MPDITVIVPVFYGDEAEPSAFVAARGHHADIGGIAPGSMPPDSRTIDDEGVLIDNELLVDEGHFREAEMRALLASGPLSRRATPTATSPTCAPSSPPACAARRRWSKPRATTGRTWSPPTWTTSSPMPRNRCGGCSTGSTTASSPMRWTMARSVRVAIRIDKAARSATFDFTGTSAQLPDNFNAPFSIVRAASLYVVRTLIDDAIPMNDGCLRPIKLIVPEGSMLNPAYPAAVVAGNVETSQVVTDALFAATGRLAPSQGTMNNFTFGNERHQYYETIAGGSGAGPDHDGTERGADPHDQQPADRSRRYWKRGCRCGSTSSRSAAARAARARIAAATASSARVTFLEPMRANILANRRRVAPRGLKRRRRCAARPQLGRARPTARSRC